MVGVFLDVDGDEWVMSDMMAYFSPIHGDGRHRRSYVYVTDVSRAFHIILRKGKTGWFSLV
jgi:dTDP-D-glucose 4,6-dehydratase